MGSTQVQQRLQEQAENKAGHADVLLVGDDVPSDKNLVRCLEEAGFSVFLVPLAGLLESKLSGSTDVLILDLQEASVERKSEVARSILSSSPEKSVLVTRAFGEAPREEEASEPQLIWLEKPLDLARLPAQVGCELKKVAVRRTIQSSPGFSPHEVLKVLSIYDGSLPGDASRDILQEIQAESGRPDMTKDPIDSLYAELAELSGRVGKEPGVEPLMKQKMARLRQLQKEEAAAMDAWFEAHRSLRPGNGYEAIKRAEKLIAHEG